MSNPEIRATAVDNEAVIFAGEKVAELEALIWQPVGLTGLRTHDHVNQGLQDMDQMWTRELAGTDSIFIGHTNGHAFWRSMYDSLVKGYGLDPEAEVAHPTNWLWDEITAEFHTEHPDLKAMLDQYGYQLREKSAPWVGSYVIPKTTVIEILVELYHRGKEYRAANLGFPWMSDPVPASSNTTITDQKG